MDGSPSVLREAPPAAPRHWGRFHTANFMYNALYSSSFVDQLSSANAIGASVRRGDGEVLSDHDELGIDLRRYVRDPG